MKDKHIPPSSTSLTVNIFMLVLFGLVMLASASSVIGYTGFDDNYYYLKHQLLFGFLPGLILFFIARKIPFKFWQKYAGLLLIIAVVLLILVFIPGIGAEYNQAKSWLNFGFATIQPAEIAKLILVIYLAAWFSKSKEGAQTFSHGILPFLILIGLLAGLIALQPDIGTLSVIGIIGVGIYFVAGLRWKHLLGLLVAAGGFFGLLVLTASYRLDRILAFINPAGDIQGIGYHINQALLAIGSGGLFGLGLGKSRQKFEFLPEVAGDSIFAVMAEELGFVFGVLFILFFVYFILKLFKLAQFQTDDFAKFFIIGLAIWFGGQAMINIGAMVGLLPLTGVPLPFVSFGGTSLMTIMAGCGILINIAKST